MLNIERQDKKIETRVAEIQKDWRVWARENGYAYTDSVFVEQEPMQVRLEVWTHPTMQEDTYLLYLPSIPHTTGGETLYIINDHERLTFMLDGVKKMVKAALIMVQFRLRTQNYTLN